MDYEGQRFGRLAVVRFARHDKNGNRYFTCRCECGTIKDIALPSLKRGYTNSCGCLRRELATARATTHGMRKDPAYESWAGMKQRCLNSSDEEYANYGGRGITVCAEWRASFEAFYADMGPRPEGRSLDRIDVNGNYEPGNCRWATAKEQRANQRRMS